MKVWVKPTNVLATWTSTPIFCSKFSVHLYKSYYLTSFQILTVHNTSAARNARVRRYDISDRKILTNKHNAVESAYRTDLVTSFVKIDQVVQTPKQLHTKMHIWGNLVGKVNVLKCSCIGYFE